MLFFLYFPLVCLLVPNIEEEAKKIAGRDGLINYAEFRKFATPTELCKVEFHDRVFNKQPDDKEKAKKEKGKGNKVSISRRGNNKPD